jgi:hypothetical protein
MEAVAGEEDFQCGGGVYLTKRRVAILAIQE